MPILQNHANDFPVLALIAHDVLAIPGVSIFIECLFLSSKHTLSNVHSSMTAESMSKAITTKEWLKKGFGYKVHYLENIHILHDTK
jgi:hypothetical protein